MYTLYILYDPIKLRKKCINIYCNTNGNYCDFNNTIALLSMYTVQSFQSKKKYFFFLSTLYRRNDDNIER